ncbi:hypothetical protein B0186_09990 [Canicola haemoglobinophilus]|uniref:UPF0208 membrane protein YfbV n=1 Tax=Canicola haemoglobinophilus TaxID=733 RepID=A0A1V4AYY0_9PAST|nr:terminus macrodomain insulation protein YfbV [Canicola haemoglobinophilus]OOR98021.1 hypothetical protein B0186_09990 [Canicola haemoglobinophilus]STO60560.1 inner membrane protein [Canicola haemoglobinophilus]
MYKTLKLGQYYLKTWPSIPKLNIIFPEHRVIKVTLFGQRFMPFLAVFSLVWQQIYAKHDIVALAIAVLTALFALSLPLQCLYWLGKRAKSPLPVQTKIWFDKIVEALQQKNMSVMPVENATYQDLAEVLRKAEQKLDAEFWQNI